MCVPARGSSRGQWGGWGSNPRPADYEKHGPALRVRYLHGYHGVVPQIALIAPLARMARSTNRSTPCHGHHRMPVTERYRGQGLDRRELRQAGDVVDLDCPPFFIDRVEDAVPAVPQAPQIRRPVRERLRRPRPRTRPMPPPPRAGRRPGWRSARSTRLGWQCGRRLRRRTMASAHHAPRRPDSGHGQGQPPAFAVTSRGQAG